MNSISKIEKKIFMAKVADQSKNAVQWISLRKKKLNRPLKIKMSCPYSHQDTMIRIGRQISTKSICFLNHQLFPFQSFVMFILNLNDLNFRAKDNADHTEFSQQLLQVQPLKVNHYLNI